MAPFVRSRLVNDPFSDAGLLLDLSFGSRAILFDLGDLSGVSPRELLRTTHVFVSHMHMDHFAGFDHLLRLSLYRQKRLEIVGPSGLVDAVEAKLGAYTWNLLDDTSPDFSIRASDWSESGFAASAVFSARRKFTRRAVDPPAGAPGRPLDEPEFHVDAAVLDHGIPCLAFALQEKVGINVHKARLDELGLPVGPWLTEAKRAARQDADPASVFSPSPGRTIALGELLAVKAFRRSPGRRIVYATDFAFSKANIARLVTLARGADELFIEAGYLAEDHGLAAAKLHLTAAQAGGIARRAGVGRAVPMHFSPRYLGREAELRSEFERAVAGGTPVGPGGSEAIDPTEESAMATNLKDISTAKSSKGEHGGNRAGQEKRDDQPDKSSQAAGKDPRRGKD